MSNTINGRTPDEIKKGLECCNTFNVCHKCPYEKAVDTEHGWGCVVIRNADALTYIQRLECERDAALVEFNLLKAKNGGEEGLVSAAFLFAKAEQEARVYMRNQERAADQKWISAVDNPPKENDIVFVYDYIEGNVALVKVLEAHLESIDVEAIFPKHGVQFVATHWMPLRFPEPPEEEK